ncbi:MAG: vitamin B12-dependent ribonucleotide reductase, partial [bacterium]
MSTFDTSLEGKDMSTDGLFGASQTGALRMNRFFSKEGIHPYDEVTWEHRYASITAENGEVIFEAHDVEMPDFWSATAGNVVISKYFRIGKGQIEREKSLRTLIDRVVDTISNWGLEDGYFQTQQEATIFA